MTEAKALEIINNFLINHVEHVEELEAFIKAGWALKNKIPRKVHIKDLNYRKQVPFCPQCESDITHFAIDSVRYCPYCGQALDWSKEEEE